MESPDSVDSGTIIRSPHLVGFQELIMVLSVNYESVKYLEILKKTYQLISNIYIKYLYSS